MLPPNQKLEKVRRKVRKLPVDWTKIAKIDIEPSKANGKKYTAIVHYKNGGTRRVNFGASGMEDWLDHRDIGRRANFRSRFAKAYAKIGNSETSPLMYSYNLLW